MALHHLICLLLFFMNVNSNRLAVTVGLTFACSVTDILMSLTKVFTETKYYIVAGPLAVFFLMPFWFYFRIIAYPINLY